MINFLLLVVWVIDSGDIEAELVSL